LTAPQATAESGPAYDTDLAFVHDAGFGDQAEAAAEQLLGELAYGETESGTVVDLGCGSGIASAKIAAAGFDVFGIDQSEAFIELAREKVPSGEFQVGSFVDATLPHAVAVLAVGEVLNYLIDPRNGPKALPRIFERIFEALVPNGVFLFDLSGPGRAGRDVTRSWRAGPDWATLAENDEDVEAATLTRKIIAFRRDDGAYRRTEETHELKLYAPNAALATLHAAGFRGRILRGYGGEEFAPGHRAFIARRPA
jgi:SAM-dependent methyltransferase